MTSNTSHVKKSKRKEAGKNVCDRHHGPPNRQADRKFTASIKVGQIEDHLDAVNVFVSRAKILDLLHLE